MFILYFNLFSFFFNYVATIFIHIFNIDQKTEPKDIINFEIRSIFSKVKFELKKDISSNSESC